MNGRKTKNIAASVRHRLQQVAKSSGRPFQEVAQYFAMERFLYRLSQSRHAEKFVLKGALMLTAWRVSELRPTRDIDLLGRMPNGVDELIRLIQDVCRLDVEPDGLQFDPATVAGVAIKEDADYEGVRVTFRGSLENVRLPMQIDVAFGDVVFPVPTVTEYPTILDHPAPKLRGYSREAAVAEKFEAMVKLGILNSRMKDFYDVWLLSRQFDFDGTSLATAIEKTFSNRGTSLTSEPSALSSTFASDQAKASQWQAFLRKSRLDHAPQDLAEVVKAIAAFLAPPAASVREGRAFVAAWKPPGLWSSDLAQSGTR